MDEVSKNLKKNFHTDTACKVLKPLCCSTTQFFLKQSLFEEKTMQIAPIADNLRETHLPLYGQVLLANEAPCTNRLEP